jgi:dCMP deaminase
MSKANWDMRYLQMAALVATFSKDPSTKIGAVCVDSKNRLKGLGYNGFSRNTADDERLHDRPTKYKMVIHAEHNCLMNCTGGTEGATMYVTLPPCLHCCAILDQHGISRVVFAQPSQDFNQRWNMQETVDYLKELGIEVTTYRRVE